MRWMRQWWQRWQDRRFARACVRRQVTPLSDAAMTTLYNTRNDVIEFCQHSGFLRDGRYPGGRHAERKVCMMLDAMAALALDAMFHNTELTLH